MDVIFKHRLSVEQDTVLTLPTAATIVLVGPQGPQGTPHLWVRQPAADGQERSTARRTFRIVGTGRPFPRGARYIGTYGFGPYVWHALELPG